MGPTPWALTMHQIKNVMPAMGTTTAFRVKRCRTLWMGIQMAGKEISQKRKKHMKSRVFVPDDAGIEFAEGMVGIAITTYGQRGTHECSPHSATSP